jgi:hypothetical protein
MELINNVRNRFIQVVVFLRMLDPVREKPTIHDLNKDSHEIRTSRERLLKRKFLDSFALICVIKRDDDSVSTTCMKKGASQGTIIRVASNFEVSERTLSQLQELIAMLNSIGSEDTLA